MPRLWYSILLLSCCSYLTADYERGNFSISQCVWNDNAQQNIETIHSTNYTAPPSANGAGANSVSNSSTSSSLTVGAIVGIVIAAVLFIACIAILALLRHFRKWPFHKRPLHPGASELDANGRPTGPMAVNPSTDTKNAIVGAVEADSKDNLHGYYRPELGSSGSKPELMGSGGHPQGKNELPGAAVHREGSHTELYGSDVAREVEGSSPMMELAGSPVGPEYYGSSTAVPGSASRDHSPSGRSGLSPESPTSGSAGRKRSPISPLARSTNPERGSPLRQSQNSNGGVRSASRSPITPQSQMFSREASQVRGRGLGIQPNGDSRLHPGDSNMI